MKQQHVYYQVVPYPKIRRFMAAAYRSTRHKPMIHGLLEVDVSRARASLREHKETTGEVVVVHSIPDCLLGESRRRAQSCAGQYALAASTSSCLRRWTS